MSKFDKQQLLDLEIDLDAPEEQPSKYERHRQRMAEQQANISAEGRDIGSIPAVANPERREKCRRDLQLFCETYFPVIFYLPWSPLQLEAINRLQTATLHGGKFAVAMPRGTGKSVLCERAAIWATVYGYRRFVVVVGSTDRTSRDSFKSIKTTFETNADLMDDFPEICYPVQMLEGIVNRVHGQTCLGERTHITWGSNKIIFPTIAGSIASGSIILGTSMSAHFRGLKHQEASGDVTRPDFVLIDDPQSRASSQSATRTQERINLIKSDIMGLSGPGKTITAVMPCTVIRPDDLAEHFLDRDLNPEWTGARFKLLEGWPKNMHLWQRYQDIRAEGLRDGSGVEKSIRYYIANRDAMDDGCRATWPERFEADEISGIHYAMNLYFLNRAMFYSEFQNEPEIEELGDGERITAKIVLERLNKRPRREIPQAASRLTFFVDVQKNLLYWCLMAFDDKFSSWLIDYGTFPDQPLAMFTTRDASPTYSDIWPGVGQEGALTLSLKELIDEFLDKPFPREDGAELMIGRALIDSGWGESTDAIYNFIRESGRGSVLMPSKGVGINATVKPFSEYQRRPGEIISPYEWQIAPVKNKRHIRLLRYDTNYWKSFFRNRILTAPGDPGAFTINGAQITDRMQFLAEHLSSEYSIAEQARGRRIDLWKLTPNKENHWLDCVTGCMVAASEQGCKLIIDPPTAAGKEPPRRAAPSAPVTRKTYSVRRLYTSQRAT